MGAHIFELFKSDLSAGTGLIYVLIGICVVFICLAIIIGLLVLLELFFRFDCTGKIAGLFKRKKKAVAPPAAVEAEPEASVSAGVSDETVAAISAAIALVMTDPATGKPVPFRIRKIRHL